MKKDRPSPQAVLEACPLLRKLADPDRQVLAQESRVTLADRAEVLWNRGCEVDFFGVAHDGFVKMTRTNGDGTETTIELMGPGQVFGLLGTVTGTGCPLSAVAVTSLWYLRIPKSAFARVYGTSLPLKDALISRSAVRLHGMVDLMVRLMGGTVEQRLAAILLIVADSYGQRERGTLRLGVPLTRQELADMASTTVESTIRTMSKWQRAGILATEHQMITIRQEKALETIVQLS